jgi:tyrosyl-tRNA synthetase
MTEYSSDLLRLLFRADISTRSPMPQALDALAAKQIVPAYIGFDPTAPSLHVGSLVQIMLLRRCSRPATSRSC